MLPAQGLLRVPILLSESQLQRISAVYSIKLLRITSPQNCITSQRFYADDGKKGDKPVQKADSGSSNIQQHGQYRSVLEEVLIQEKKKPTTFTGKVAEKAENTFLYSIVAGSVALLGVFAYFLLQEFFAEDSPQLIYSRALKMVQNDGRCQDLFGSSIKGFGEETSRGRRRHVAHHKYEKDGKQRIRVLFHIKGDRDEGTAQVETEYRDGIWEYRFLIVDTKTRPRTTHVLIDNRVD